MLVPVDNGDHHCDDNYDDDDHHHNNNNNNNNKQTKTTTRITTTTATTKADGELREKRKSNGENALCVVLFVWCFFASCQIETKRQAKLNRTEPNRTNSTCWRSSCVERGTTNGHDARRHWAGDRRPEWQLNAAYDHTLLTNAGPRKRPNPSSS
ncbi:hypothetical protein T06_15782 [Trichinella sp. T6]|nr:hypothetical protein T06_15782 [Trichinella sp. T6]